MFVVIWAALALTIGAVLIVSLGPAAGSRGFRIAGALLALALTPVWWIFGQLWLPPAYLPILTIATFAGVAQGALMLIRAAR